MTNSIYKYWDTEEGFSGWKKPRKWDDRFRSEKHFFEKIFKPGMSVLDIGCATGDLHTGLLEQFGEHEYVGIDTSPVMIDGAKKMNPDIEFHVGDVLHDDLLGDRKFDVVTATGVFQHEPNYRELLKKMLEYTKEGGYVLFDFKLFHTHGGLEDINISYCDLPDRLFFNVLNFHDSLDWLKQIEEVSKIEMFGYYSGTHKSVRLPSDIDEEVCSAHVLLIKERAESGPSVEVELPKNFIL